MASGFLVLPDGRCLARRWTAHDEVLRAVAEEVRDTALRDWILSQLPGPDDEVELGYGAWLRAADEQVIPRHIDLRLMTAQNQRLFCDAARKAASVPRSDESLSHILDVLDDMIQRMDREEPPLSRSDFTRVTPPENTRIGPGWPDE